MQAINQTNPQQDRYSYLMMFCALMMVRNSRATLAESLEMLPLSSRVSNLAGELTHGQMARATGTRSAQDAPPGRGN